MEPAKNDDDDDDAGSAYSVADVVGAANKFYYIQIAHGAMEQKKFIMTYKCRKNVLFASLNRLFVGLFAGSFVSISFFFFLYVHYLAIDMRDLNRSSRAFRTKSLVFVLITSLLPSGSQHF